MKMKKKALISLMLTLCIAIVMLLPAYAITPTRTLLIGGSEYDANTDQNGTGWLWDSNNLTLVLNSYVGDRIEYVSDGSTDTIKVLLAGENSITNTFTNGATCSNKDDAMSFEAAVEIDGTFPVAYVSGSATQPNGTINITNVLNSPDDNADDCISNYFDHNINTISVKNATINFLGGEYGIYTKISTFDNVKFNSTDLYDAICVDDITINNSEIKIVDSEYGIDFIDIAATNSSFKFNYSNHVATYESIAFDTWRDTDSSNEKYHTSDAIFTKCDIDITFKIDDVTDNNTYLYAFYETDNVTFNETKVNFANKDGVNSHAYTELFGDCGKVNILNKSEVTFTDICDVIYCDEWQLVDSKMIGECCGCFTNVTTATISNSEFDVECLDKTTDNYWMSFGLSANELNIINSSVRVKTTESAINTNALNITDSAVYFESVDMNVIDTLDDYTLTYTTPKYWQVLIDGVPSTAYTVESYDIVFGPKSFEIKFIHEHSYSTISQIAGDEGLENHLITCECGKTQKEAHAWSDGVAAGTVKENGKEYKLTKYTCTKCGATKTVKTLIDNVNVPIPKTGSDSKFSSIWNTELLKYALLVVGIALIEAHVVTVLVKKKERNKNKVQDKDDTK